MTTATQETAEASATAYLAASQEAMSSEEKGVDFEAAQPLGHEFISEFAQAEQDRRPTEERWLRDLRQFRGIYDPEVLAELKNRSQAFVRKTRVKVNTVDARMIDLLFPDTNEKNFTVKPTPSPSVGSDAERRIKATLAKVLGALPDQETLDKAVLDAVTKAAEGMSKVIEDQLVESGYKSVAKQVVHSGNLYGTGVLKAPLVEKKVRTKYVNRGGRWVIESEEYIVPFVDFVPLWRFYPDMASTTLDDCRYVYERHMMSKQAMLKLATRKSFRKQAIIDYVKANPKGQVVLRYADTELRQIGERVTNNTNSTGQYEVLERWGWLDAEQLRGVGVKIPQERENEIFFSNCWVLPNGTLIKAVIQPINGVTWPYHLYYFDKDETNIFGEGLAAIMRDDQTMLNAAVRMILDNGALTAGPQLEVNTSLVGTGEKVTEMFPFKIWTRSGLGDDAKAPAVRVLEIPNSIAELREIAVMFENNADEVTAIPRYWYGENPTGGAAGTMGGLSMLMGAASIVLKELITNFDEGITKRFIQALYHWNMQFNPKNEIKGDFDICAMGVASLVAKELRAKQLDEFSQLAANPLDAPFIKREKLLRQRADAHELTDVVKTEEEVQTEQNGPAGQLAAAQQELQMQTMQLQVATLQGKLAQIEAQAEKARAEAMDRKLSAAYAAMEAAGVATSNPGVAAAGDALLRAAGWVDAPNPNQPQGSPMPVDAAGQPVEVPPQGSIPESGSPIQPQDTLPTAHEGMRQGIETARLTDG